MNLHEYLSVAPEIAEAIAQGKPVVALESTILSHGMPYPENVEFAHKVEKIVREEGAIPATTAIIGGKLKVGLNDEELLTMCKAENVGKVSRRDVAVYLATGQTGATTVATTMIIASLAGIRFFATGGIGGVHRGAEKTMDISADLHDIAPSLRALENRNARRARRRNFGVVVVGRRRADDAVRARDILCSVADGNVDALAD